jgi:hypothetical protein
MYPKIIAAYGEYGVNVGKIVQRIIKYAPKDSIKGLNTIRIVDKSPDKIGFACYLKDHREIYLFVEDIIGWQPWLLKKTFIFPYITIGLALGHEIDHHVNRDNNTKDKERSAERNAIKYIYPSFGVFKPIALVYYLIIRIRRRESIMKSFI